MKLLAILATVSMLAADSSAAADKAEPPHFADADNDALVTQGTDIYIRNCSNCHGRRLQGQALWQLRDQYEGRRAPPHDSTGHTWQHSDEDLFHMTKYGHFAATPPGVVSFMPAFEHSLKRQRYPRGSRFHQIELAYRNSRITIDAQSQPSWNAGER